MAKKFEPGNCANPRGRPTGALGDPTKRLRRLIRPHVAQLVEQRLAAALSGDAEAANVVLMFYQSTTA